jgi:hypothetical protein
MGARGPGAQCTGKKIWGPSGPGGIACGDLPSVLDRVGGPWASASVASTEIRLWLQVLFGVSNVVWKVSLLKWKWYISTPIPPSLNYVQNVRPYFHANNVSLTNNDTFSTPD